MSRVDWQSPFSGQNSNLANNGGKQQKTTKNNTFLDFDKKTALEIFLIFGMMLVEMILYHSMQTTCPGKSWFSSYGLKSSWPIRSLNYFFRLCKERLSRIFWILHDDSGDDSLPSHTNCMSRKSLFLELWPKKLSASQIAWWFFQTLTNKDCKEFSEFLHDDSGDDSLPLCTNCMFRKILVPELWPKKFPPNQIARLIISLDYILFQALRVFLIFCLILNHYTQIACSGKLWFLSYIWPQIVAWKVRNYVVFTYIVFSSLWCHKSSVLSYVDNF